jgi:hypothetical protein
VTYLRQIMLEELKRRNYAESTIRAYLRAVEHFSRHFHRRPDQLGPEHIRQYQACTVHPVEAGPRLRNTAASRVAFLLCSEFGGQNLVVRRDWYLGDGEASRVEGEFTLPSICDDLFAWSSLVQRYQALRCLLQILNKFLSAQSPAGMRALANDGRPRFRLPCAEVLLPSCASPVVTVEVS